MSEKRMDDFKLPEVLYDGGQIWVTKENHAPTIAWFEKYAGWKRTGQEFKEYHTIDEVKEISSLNTSIGWGVEVCFNVFHTLPNAVESNVRWCFKTPNLQKFHTTLSENGEKVTKIYRGPYDQDYFDFLVTEGVWLTAQGAPDIENEGLLLSHDWLRIGVSELQKAKEWYVRFIGMSVLSEHPEEGYVVMGMRFNFQDSEEKRPIVVLEQLQASSSSVPKDERKLPYTYVNKSTFVDYHQFLSGEGIPISEISGSLKGLAKFNIFDPDGNRFNFRTF